MTLNGAIMQLTELHENPMMPNLFKPAIQKVIETISEFDAWQYHPADDPPEDAGTVLLDVDAQPFPFMGYYAKGYHKFIIGDIKTAPSGEILGWWKLPERLEEEK